jgi:hypothetical protein
MPVGGKREGAGRPVGSLNKTTADIKALAQSFGPAAIMRLAELAGFALDPDDETGTKRLPPAASETAQIAATKELLDRGYGKSVQPQSGPDGESNPVVEVVYRWGGKPTE